VKFHSRAQAEAFIDHAIALGKTGGWLGSVPPLEWVATIDRGHDYSTARRIRPPWSSDISRPRKAQPWRQTVVVELSCY